MSKRFGRNQKRRMREQLVQQQAQISNLETARALDAGLLRYQRRKVEDYVQIIQDVRETLGDNHIALPPDVGQMVVPDDQTAFQVPLRQPLQMYDYAADIGAMSTKALSEYLHVLLVKSAVRDFGHHVIVGADLAGKKSRYAISDDGLRNIRRDRLELILAENIARHLVDQLKEVPQC